MSIPKLRDLSLCVTEYQRTLDEGYNMAVRDMQAVAPTPATANTGWNRPEMIPDVREGTDAYFWIAVKRHATGKIHSFPAVYCNDYPLCCEDPEDAEGNQWKQRENPNPNHGDGDIFVTGFYDIKSDAEYDFRYSPALEKGDELIAWKRVEAYPA